MDIPAVNRLFLVNGIIAPFRAPRSGASYKEIWNPETGSPLMHYSLLQQKLWQNAIDDSYRVGLAMRYQKPHIESALEALRDRKSTSLQSRHKSAYRIQTP